MRNLFTVLLVGLFLQGCSALSGPSHTIDINKSMYIGEWDSQNSNIHLKVTDNFIVETKTYKDRNSQPLFSTTAVYKINSLNQLEEISALRLNTCFESRQFTPLSQDGVDILKKRYRNLDLEIGKKRSAESLGGKRWWVYHINLDTSPRNFKIGSNIDIGIVPVDENTFKVMQPDGEPSLMFLKVNN